MLTALTVLVVIELASTGSGTPAGQQAGTQPAAAVVGTEVTIVNEQSPLTVVTSVPTTVTVNQPGPITTVDQVEPSTTGSGLTATNPNGSFGADLAAGALPPGGAFTVRGNGTWHVVPGTSPVVGTGSKHYTYIVEVEDGIEPPATDAEFATAVDATLADARSWTGGGNITLQRIDTGEPSFRISLTSQMTVRGPDKCGWTIPLEASCYNRVAGRVFINDARWVRGAVSYHGDLGLYRAYAINHEIGHALGYDHEPCPENGGLAPVMMQQSWSTADDDLAKLAPGGPVPPDGKVCIYNPFPYPRGGPAPGAG